MSTETPERRDVEEAEVRAPLLDAYLQAVRARHAAATAPTATPALACGLCSGPVEERLAQPCWIADRVGTREHDRGRALTLHLEAWCAGCLRLTTGSATHPLHLPRGTG